MSTVLNSNGKQLFMLSFTVRMFLNHLLSGLDSAILTEASIYCKPCSTDDSVAVYSLDLINSFIKHVTDS